MSHREPPPAATWPVPIRVVPYEPGRAAHHDAYRALNLAWIEAHFAVEPRDRRELDDAEGHMLAHGGHILMAEADGPGSAEVPEVLGTCALLREPDGACELAKMAVHEAARRPTVQHRPRAGDRPVPGARIPRGAPAPDRVHAGEHQMVFGLADPSNVP